MKQFKFLLADDDHDDVGFFEQKLHELSPEAELERVVNGEQVADYLSHCDMNQLPCVIIVDYNMPKMSAPEILDWLYAHPQYNGIAKYVWSTAHEQKYVDDCISKGAIEYFVKPNNERGLAQIIQKMLKHCV